MFFGMMRVKDEERWIARSLTSLLEVCDEVFILDDHSTDRTRNIIDAIGGCTVIPSPFNTLDESRDKTYLLKVIEDSSVQISGHLLSPHWVICIDGDEEIVGQDLHKFTQEPPQGIGTVSYSFQIITLYDSLDTMRVDPPYDAMFRPSMFRLIKPGMVFRSNARHGGGFHCSNVPADIGFGVTTHNPEPVRVKHYGYMDAADRERKYKWYLERDPGHADWYRKECLETPTLKKLPVDL
jgi:glycosyltransferase involved in cell wall biosynthesis